METRIIVTSDEYATLRDRARRKGMRLSAYLREQLGLPRIPAEVSREDGQAPWLHRALRAGYSEPELRVRAQANGLSLKEACEAVA